MLAVQYSRALRLQEDVSSWEISQPNVGEQTLLALQDVSNCLNVIGFAGLRTTTFESDGK